MGPHLWVPDSVLLFLRGPAAEPGPAGRPGGEGPSGKKALGRGAALGSLCPDARVKPKALAPPAGRGQHCSGGGMGVKMLWWGDTQSSARCWSRVASILCRQTGRYFSMCVSYLTWRMGPEAPPNSSFKQ